MQQRCTLINIWLTWLGLPILAGAVGYVAGWPAGVLVLVVGVAAELVYLRFFPALSRSLGYGSVADEAAAIEDGSSAPNEVVLYTANICPFCPIVRRRLQALQGELRFEIREVDVTFQPGIVRAKGLRSVPVVEAGGRFLSGNATSAQLAGFLVGGPGSSAADR